jgi:hypothetical protein
MNILRVGSLGVVRWVRWLLFEVLPLPMRTTGCHVAAVACRVAGCGVSFGVLSVELQASARSHGEELVLLWAASALTALLIGNIAREMMFEACTSVATLLGRPFLRDGVTLTGRTFLEIHYPTMTWVRCECGADGFSYEWTETTGRCNRVEVQFRANCGRNAEETPEVRVITAPRMNSSGSPPTCADPGSCE